MCEFPDKEIKIRLVKDGYHFTSMTRTKDFPYATYLMGTGEASTLEEAIEMVKSFFADKENFSTLSDKSSV